jgi:hypothetical protein
MKSRTRRKTIVRASTAELEREMIIDSFEPPGAEAKARWERAKRKRGRPPVGEGALGVSVSVERGLLERADRLADKLHITRAALIARGLRAVLAAQGVE